MSGRDAGETRVAWFAVGPYTSYLTHSKQEAQVMVASWGVGHVEKVTTTIVREVCDE